MASGAKVAVMSAPRHIIDSLESVLSVYFSNCRHKERAAFILCDELVEVTCREKIKQTLRNLGNMNFRTLMTHAELDSMSQILDWESPCSTPI